MALSFSDAAARDPRAAGGRSFGAVLRQLESAQKPGHGVPAYTRWVNRGLARFAAAAAVRLGLGPNAVSAISVAFSAAAIAVLLAAPPVPAAGLAAAVLLATGYMLDSADGQVARVTGTGSPAGEWLDHVLDAVRVPAIHLAVFVGLATVPGVPGWFGWVPLAYTVMAAGHFMSQILAEQLLRQQRLPDPAPEAPAHPGSAGRGVARSVLFLPTDTGTLCWVFVLWGLPGAFVAAYTALFLLNAVSAAASVRRKYVSLRPAPASSPAAAGR